MHSKSLQAHQQPNLVEGTPQRTDRRLGIGVVTYNNSSTQLRQAVMALEIASRRLAERGIRVAVHALDNGLPCELPECGVRTWKASSKGNVGFGQGMNRLMKRAFLKQGAQWFLCLNPDGIMHRDCLRNLLECARDNPTALIEARQFPEEHPRDYHPNTGDTPWASGACLLIPRLIYQRIGGFDPNIFMYMEDVDFSWRARAAGFKVLCCPTALFGHSVLGRAASRTTEKYYLISGRYLAWKWGNEKFQKWTEEQLVERGHFQDDRFYPTLPDLTERSAMRDLGIADFEHQFFVRTGTVVTHSRMTSRKRERRFLKISVAHASGS